MRLMQTTFDDLQRSVFELTTRSLTAHRVRLEKSKVWDLFFGRIGGRYGERQELTWLGVSRIGSCMTK